MKLKTCFLGLALLGALTLSSCGKPANTDTKPANNETSVDQLYRQSAVLVARFLESEHFARHPIDAETGK